MAAVKADIFTAQKRVRGLADDAVVTLAADPDAKALRKDLRALEKALLSAREAEITFSAALTAKGIDTPATDMRDYLESVERKTACAASRPLKSLIFIFKRA